MVPVEEIVITAPEGGPTSPLWERIFNVDPYALLLIDADATISGLTFTGLGSEVIARWRIAHARADSVFDEVGWSFDGSDTSPNGSSVVITNGGSATVRGNVIRGGGPIALFGGANATISSNTLAGGPHIYLANHGPATVIIGNTIEDTHRWAIGAFYTDGDVVIEDNIISRPGRQRHQPELRLRGHREQRDRRRHAGRHHTPGCSHR